jgi:uncharacterized protein
MRVVIDTNVLVSAVLNKFIACALAGRANFLITGDRDFTEAQALMDTTIISVSLFKRLVCDMRQ